MHNNGTTFPGQWNDRDQGLVDRHGVVERIPGIPSASGWRMAVMALALLAVGTVVITGRRSCKKSHQSLPSD